MILTLWNGAMPTTAKSVAVATGSSILTLLQVKGLVPLKIIEWGICFSAFAAAAPVVVELISTGTVFATVTASAEADINKIGAAADLAADVLTLGTSATGFTSSGEGSITATKPLDSPIFIPNTGLFVKQFPLGQEPIIYKGDSGRIRVHAGTTYNAYCWLKLST